MRKIFSLVFLVPFAVGCTSISSTLLEKDAFGVGWVKNDLKGVPITLKVPTHIKVDVLHREYVCMGDLKGEESKRKLRLKGQTTPYSSINFVTQIVETEKVFTVDLPRPASGGLKYNAKFKDRYIDSIQSSANDDTIRQSSLALQRFITNVATGQSVAAQPVVSAGTLLDTGVTANAGNRKPIPSSMPMPVLFDSKGAPAELSETGFAEEAELTIEDKKYTRVDGLLCSRLFSLDDADVEQQVRDFMGQYSNSSTVCH